MAEVQKVDFALWGLGMLCIYLSSFMFLYEPSFGVIPETRWQHVLGQFILMGLGMVLVLYPFFEGEED